MKFLALNLATQPVEQVVRARKVLTVVGSVILLLTVLHLALLWILFSDSSVDAASASASRETIEAVQAEELDRWSEEVDALMAAADPRRLQRIAEDVALANELIAWRVLPWGEVFEMLEAALPDKVRLELVRPNNAEIGLELDLIAAADDRSDLTAFMASLENVPEIVEAYPLSEELGLDGKHRMTLRARYVAVPEPEAEDQ
jgi:Tfp pilus assembly protein PilN